MSILSRISNIKSAKERLDIRAKRTSEKYHIPKIRLIMGYFFCVLFYGCTMDDYFLYKFFLLNRKGKKQFITGWQQSKYDKKHSDGKNKWMFYNKEANLDRFADYMKRDWCGQMYHNTEEEYRQFAKKHSRGIIKPHGDYGGHGIRIVPTDEIDGMDLYTYCKKNNVLIEELITQHENVDVMYPKAINTIRIVTNNGDIVAAAFRMGAGGGEVDNATSGGIFAEVDVDTGIVVSRGCRMNGEEFLVHPDTGTVIPGFRIPMWDECISMVTDAVKLVEGATIVGWDVAVSSNGPTIVEVNDGPGMRVIQVPNGHGIRDMILQD